MLVRISCLVSFVISIAQGMSPRAQIPLDISHIRVSSLNTEGVSPFEALLTLGNSASLPLGIAVSDPSLYTSRMSRNFDGGTCDEALKLILEAAPKYTKQESHGVILISVPGKFEQNGLLQYHFDRFDTFRPMNATDVSVNIWGVLQLNLNPKRTGYGGVLRTPALDTKIVPVIDMYNVSLEEILDKMVISQGHMAWVSWPPPSNLIDVPQYLLWNLVFYDIEPATQKLCCIHVPPNLPEVSGELRKRLE